MTEGTQGPSIASAHAESRAVGQVIAATLGFAAIAIFAVLATREGTPLSMVLLGRYAVATVALLPALRWVRANPLDGWRISRLLIVGGIGQAIVATLSLAALAYIPVSTLVFLFYTYPVWVTILAGVRGLESLDARKLSALGLSLLGLGLLVGLPGAAALEPRGVALALSAALAYAIYVPLMGHLQRGVDAAFTSLLISIGVAVIFAVATIVRGELRIDLTLTSWAAILALGVLCTATAFRLFLAGLATLGSVKTSIICTVEPLFATAMAVLVLDQPITRPIVAGGALILGAVVILQTGKRENA
ncbi:MAG: DMT family transporter [Gemmatimonadaceae bacterium]